MAAAAAALEQYFTVLRYDTCGHGQTDAPAGAYTLDQLTDDALGLLDALKIERTHFCGLSMGAMIGQYPALKAPQRIDRLVLADTTSRMRPEAAPLWAERIRTSPVRRARERWWSRPWRAGSPNRIARRIRIMD